LKNQFEALAFNPDYIVIITGTETRKNLVFSYTVFKMKVMHDEDGVKHEAILIENAYQQVKLKNDMWVVYRTFNDFKELHAKVT